MPSSLTRSFRHYGPFRLHRLALMPAGRDVSPAAVFASLSALDSAGQELFFGFLQANGLGPWWHSLVQSGAVQTGLPNQFLAKVRQSRAASTATFMAQKAALQQLDQLFQSRAIAYAVIKGVHVRELAYDKPDLRQASDIDILVTPAQRESTARALIEAGFAYHPDAENISHEALFSKNSVTVDLHWNILRPGRTRTNVADMLVGRRRWVDGFWCLDDTDAVFLMLVHPAFAKYVCSPNMSLNRVLDFLLWMQKRETDWNAVAEMLEKTGLKTAAWTVLTWFALLVEGKTDVPADFLARVRPGVIRAAYLRLWLRNDLPTRWFKRPLLIQMGFTLLLHDTIPGALRAILGWWRARRARFSDPLMYLPEGQA